jgi:hypothetical protein
MVNDMIMAHNNKYPVDGVRLDWELIITEVQEAMNKDSNNLELLAMLMELKRLYMADDIAAYFEFCDNHKNEYEMIRKNQ